jgi:phage-related protein
MPLDIPSDLIIEKNKLHPSDPIGDVWGFDVGAEVPAEIEQLSTSADAHDTFVELLEIQKPTGTPIRIVNNGEDVVWGGYSWTKFRFMPGDVTVGDDSDSKSLVIKVSAISGLIEEEIEDATDNMIGYPVIYRMVHTAYPDLDPLIEENFETLEIVSSDEWHEFEVGTENFYNRQFPAHVYSRNTCRYWPWMTDVCGYTNSSSCDRSFARCIALNRSPLFGGQPGIPGGVWIVS